MSRVKIRQVFNAVVLVVLCICMAALLGCSSESDISQADSEKTVARVAALKGPTSIGLVNFMHGVSDSDFSQGLSGDYQFEISGTADEVLPGLMNGDIDIALIPANAASTVYNKSEGAIEVINVNTLGVLYVVSGDESVGSFEDLRGKTVLMTGKGTTPEYVMNYLLESFGMAEEVNLEYKSEATEIAAILATDSDAIAVLPEPYVSSVNSKYPEIEARVSLTEAWSTVTNSKFGEESELVTGVTVARREFAENFPEIVVEFNSQQASSVNVANENVESTGSLVADLGIVDNATIAAKAIPRCNLVCLTGTAMKESLSSYYQVLYSADPASIGNKLPSDDFYREV